MEFRGINFTIVIDVGVFEIILSFFEEFSFLTVWHALGELFESSYALINGDDSVAIGVNILENMFQDLFGGGTAIHNECFKLSKAHRSALC